MDDKVGIPADRRGEVCIGFGCEAEVSHVFFRVLGLFHGAKQNGINQSFLGRAFGLGKRSLQVQGPYFFCQGQGDAKGGEEFCKVG